MNKIIGLAFALVNGLSNQCQEQIDLSGFVARDMSAFLFRERGRHFGTGGERRTFAFLDSGSSPGVIHSHFPAALAEHGGKWLWVTPLGHAAFFGFASMSFPCLS